MNAIRGIGGPMSQDTAPDYSALTLDELVAERERLLVEKQENADVLDSCRAQIAAAKARVWSDKVYEDPKWFAAVNSRARYAGRRDQELGSTLAKLRRLISQAQAAPHALDPADPVSLLIEALKLTQQAIGLLKRKDAIGASPDAV
jgi:hypothetical protein